MAPTTASHNKFTAAEPYASVVTLTVFGSHGWGMHQQSKTSDHSINEFCYWFGVQGLAHPVL